MTELDQSTIINQDNTDTESADIAQNPQETNEDNTPTFDQLKQNISEESAALRASILEQGRHGIVSILTSPATVGSEEIILALIPRVDVSSGTNLVYTIEPMGDFYQVGLSRDSIGQPQFQQFLPHEGPLQPITLQEASENNESALGAALKQIGVVQSLTIKKAEVGKELPNIKQEIAARSQGIFQDRLSQLQQVNNLFE